MENEKVRQDWSDTFAKLKKELPKKAYEYMRDEAVKEHPELEGVI